MNSKRNSNSLDGADNEPFLAKKISLEHKLISEKKNHPDINIDEQEINKFVSVFNMLLETSLSDETEAEDGVQDIILAVGSGLLKLLKGNIESLKLPTDIKNALKKLKSFLFLIDNKVNGVDKNGCENSLGSETKTISKKTTSSTMQRT